MVNFPTSVVNFLQLQDGVDRIIALHPNSRGDEITAIQTMLGAMGASQAYSESYKNVLLNYLHGCRCEFKDASSFYVRTGEIVIGDGGTGVRFRRNTADITADFTMLDTGSVASSTTYYVYAVADASGTTFLVKLSTSSSAPAGSTFYRKIGVVVTDGSSNIVDGNVSSIGQGNLLGAWQGVSESTIYQAPSDGFVVGWIGASGNDFIYVIVYTDSSASPSVARYKASHHGAAEDQCGFCVPVKKGDYYDVDISGPSVVAGDCFFIGLG